MQKELLNAKNMLAKGGIILYPTDTVWGIGCDATSSAAVEKVYNLKKRPLSKSFIVLIDSAEKLSIYVEEIPEIAWDLIKNFDKPLTIIYPKVKNLAHNVLADDGTVGIRIAKDPFCSQLIKELGKPIVSTSANISGEPTPLLFSKINPEIINSVDYIVNLHKNQILKTKPSTIIRLNKNGEFNIIRG